MSGRRQGLAHRWSCGDIWHCTEFFRAATRNGATTAFGSPCGSHSASGAIADKVGPGWCVVHARARPHISSPVAATATPVPAATEQQHDNDDNQNQFHGMSPSGFMRRRRCSAKALRALVQTVNFKMDWISG
jgi:hypothetical protein